MSVSNRSLPSTSSSTIAVSGRVHDAMFNAAAMSSSAEAASSVICNTTSNNTVDEVDPQSSFDDTKPDLLEMIVDDEIKNFGF